MRYTQSRILRSSENYTRLRIAQAFAFAYNAQMPLKIRELREALGWTQMELAERAGLRQATISKVESKPEKTELATLLKLAEAFDVQVGDLVTGIPGNTNIKEMVAGYLRLGAAEKALVTKQIRAISTPDGSAL